MFHLSWMEYLSRSSSHHQQIWPPHTHTHPAYRIHIKKTFEMRWVRIMKTHKSIGMCVNQQTKDTRMNIRFHFEDSCGAFPSHPKKPRAPILALWHIWILGLRWWWNENLRNEFSRTCWLVCRFCAENSIPNVNAWICHKYIAAELIKCSENESNIYRVWVLWYDLDCADQIHVWRIHYDTFVKHWAIDGGFLLLS